MTIPSEFDHWLEAIDVVRKDGSFNEEQARLELLDYYNFINESSKVYDHVTNGRVSKPNTRAEIVCSLADEAYEKIYQNHYTDDLEHILDVHGQDGESVQLAVLELVNSYRVHAKNLVEANMEPEHVSYSPGKWQEELALMKSLVNFYKRR